MRLQQSGERRSEPGESLAPDRSRRQAGGLAAERGRHPVELAIGGLWSNRRSSPGSKAAELASEARLEAAVRRASGRPLINPRAKLSRGPRAAIAPSGSLRGLCEFLFSELARPGSLFANPIIAARVEELLVQSILSDQFVRLRRQSLSRRNEQNRSDCSKAGR